VNKGDHKIYLRDKQNLDSRLVRKQYEDPPNSIFQDANIHYQISERTRAIGFGGIGALHKLVCKLGWDRAINKNIVLLKVHVPYWESDHVLNSAYNFLTSGTCLEDIERLRNTETYMNALDAGRIPDPTRAGDFLRRFEDETWILALQETITETRAKVWELQDSSLRKEAIIGIDGAIAGTTGECKEGMDLYQDVMGLMREKKVRFERYCPLPTKPPVDPKPTHVAPEILQREKKRQRTLKQRKDKDPVPTPPANQLLVRSNVADISDFRTWPRCPAPFNLTVNREHYADGHADTWVLVDTANAANGRMLVMTIDSGSESRKAIGSSSASSTT
jgi:hypothetical protein